MTNDLKIIILKHLKRFIQNTFFDQYFPLYEIESDIHSYYSMMLSILTEDLKVKVKNENKSTSTRLFLNN